MVDIAIALGFILSAPVIIDPGVHETSKGRFDLPVILEASVRKDCKEFHLWISADQGRTWKRYGQMDSEGTLFTVAVPKDGHYWFTVQTFYKGGWAAPPRIDGTEVDMKVYVNTARRTVIRKEIAGRVPQPLPLEGPIEIQMLKRNLEELHATVHQLRKRVAELEDNRGSK
jgi:hypothetical protein